MKEAVVIVTPGFPANEEDTTCLPAFQQFALSLNKLFPEKKLIVISFQYPFEKKEYLWHGIPVMALGGKNKSKINRLLIWMQAYSALKKTARLYKITGLISLWLGECALVTNIFAKRNALKHVTWIIGQDAKPNNAYVKRMQPKPEQLIAMSDFLQEEFLKNYFIKPAYVMENGINEAIFPAYNAGERPIDILGAGSLIPLKNYSLFIELIAELKKIKPDINAVIAGAGEEQEKLHQLITTHNLQNNVRLAGLKTHPETLYLMSQSNVFLHTSVYEGNSTVLMEALYSGCLAISTCPLSNAVTENLFVSRNKNELLQQLSTVFSQKEKQQKRVVFNTMDSSATRIMGLFNR